MNKSVQKLSLFSTFVLISMQIDAAENVVSSCQWLVDQPKKFENYTNLKKVEDSLNTPQWEKISNNAFLKVKEKRIYLHSLPNESCKSELFVVKGDMLEEVDFLDDSSWTRVAYKSKRLGKDIVGWIQFSGVCRAVGSTIKFDC